MTTKAALDALDKAATQGTFIACGWGDGSTQMGMTNIFIEDAEVLFAECIPEADAAFVCALVNAYRTGQLVPREAVEGAVKTLQSLRYWFDTDEEILAAMTPDDRSDNARQIAKIDTALASLTERTDDAD